MPNINKYRIAVVILAVAVVALVIVLITENGGHVPSAGNLEQYIASSTPQTPAPQGGNTGATSPTGVNAPRMPLVGFTIHLLAPIANESWAFNTQNTVTWDRAAGVAGYIELLNASTRSVVGIINPSTGPNQTSYTWNTRDLQLSLVNPLRKDVVPGTYLIRLIFTGNSLAPVTSAPFTITQ